jgi:hypothetical protein
MMNRIKGKGALSFIDLSLVATQFYKAHASCPFGVHGSALGYNPDLMNSTDACNHRLYGRESLSSRLDDIDVVPPARGSLHG